MREGKKNEIPSFEFIQCIICISSRTRKRGRMREQAWAMHRTNLLVFQRVIFLGGSVRYNDDHQRTRRKNLRHWDTRRQFEIDRRDRVEKSGQDSVGNRGTRCVCLYLSGALLLQLHAFLLQTVDERFELVALVFQRFEFTDQDGECFALAVEFLLQDLNLNGGRDVRALVDCAR